MNRVLPWGFNTSSKEGGLENRALLERLRLLELVVKHAADSIVITEAEPIDLPGPRIVYVNRAFTTKTGYLPEEVIGKSPRILQGPNTDRKSLDKVRAALRAWEPIEIEILNYRKDGSSFWVEMSVVPIADETGYFTNWVSVQRDLTERKAAHEALTRSRVAEAEATTLAVEAQQRKRIEEQLALSATHDDLTGLRNRKYFMRGMQDAVARATASVARGSSVLSINVDRFKSINATIGHRAGDDILREVAKRLKQNARTPDLLSRVSGNEFAMLLKHSDGSDALAIADRIAKSFAEPVMVDDASVLVSLSIGVTSFANGLRDAETLLRDAGTAMHVAQGAGGGRTVIFTDAMEANVSSALRAHSDLRGAVERNEFRVHYQPIVDLAGGHVAGFEALIRWQHPTRGLVGPLHFIPQAEEAGLIEHIGAWVLDRACTMAAQWQHLSRRPLSMSVNVTSQQLLDDRFVDEMRGVLERTQLAPNLLQLEVTESVLLAGPARIEPLFRSIRALGVKIAFDDFGTGYSSLGYLERFQIDVLKIDQSFVARLNDTSAKSEIVRMIVALAHGLGVKVIAEGVEERSQCEALCELGCTDMQGFLFSRPIPEEELTAHIEADWDSKSELRDVLGRRSMNVRYRALTAAQRADLATHVDQMIAAHYASLSRLQEAVETGESALDVAKVAREDCCPEGEWLSLTIDPALRESPLYVIAKARHAVFHRSAARLLSLALARDSSARASLAPGGDFHMVASLMLASLEDWRAMAVDA